MAETPLNIFIDKMETMVQEYGQRTGMLFGSIQFDFQNGSLLDRIENRRNRRQVAQKTTK